MRYHPFAHFGLKVMSAALAVLLWMMVSAQRSSVERGLRIPLEVQNLPDNIEMVDPPQDTVDVRVRGAADVMGHLAPGDLVANIDLTSAQPASVAIRFELSATRVVSVEPSVEGEPAPGFIVGDITSQPQTVEVVGPESLLRHVTEAITEPVWVGGAKAAIRSTVPLGVAEQGVRLKATRNALVNVEILQAPDERILTVPVRLRNLGTGLSALVVPPTVKVRTRGTKATIGKLKDGAVVAFVDLDGIGEGDYGLPVRLVPTPGLGIDQLDPTIVRIHVQ